MMLFKMQTMQMVVFKGYELFFKYLYSNYQRLMYLRLLIHYHFIVATLLSNLIQLETCECRLKLQLISQYLTLMTVASQNNMAPPAACKGLSTCVYVKETSMILELFLYLWFEFLVSLVLLHLYCSPA